MYSQVPNYSSKKTTRKVTSSSEIHKTAILDTNSNTRRPAPRSAPSARMHSSRIPMTERPTARKPTATPMVGRSTSIMLTENPMTGRSATGRSVSRIPAGPPTMRIPTGPISGKHIAPPSMTSTISKTTIIQPNGSKITKSKTTVVQQGGVSGQPTTSRFPSATPRGAVSRVPGAQTGEIPRRESSVGSSTSRPSVRTRKKVTQELLSKPAYRVKPGTNIVPIDAKPHQVQSKGQVFSSPVGMRIDLQRNLPKDIKPYGIFPKVSKSPRHLQKAPGMADVLTGNMEVERFSDQAAQQPYYGSRGMLDASVDPEIAQHMWGTQFGTPDVYYKPTAEQLADDLLSTSIQNPNCHITGQVIKETELNLTPILTTEGFQNVVEQKSVGKTIVRGPDGEIVEDHLGVADMSITGPSGMLIRTELHAAEVHPHVRLRLPNALELQPAPLHEVIGATSTTSIISEGQIERKQSVVYETTRPATVSVNEVSAMIEEENRDVEKTLQTIPGPQMASTDEASYPVRKRYHSFQLHSDSVLILEQSIIHPKHTADEEQEEMQPELLAAIMHTEEKGIAMGTKPTQLYNYLFPEEKVDQVVNVSTIAPSPLQDVVVPMKIPSTLHLQSMNDELTRAAMTSQQAGYNPKDDIYAESVMRSEGPIVRNVARAKSRRPVKTIASEEPPWKSSVDVGPIVEVVGAEPAYGLQAAMTMHDSMILDERAPRIEYLLTMEGPKFVSRAQLRGTNTPPWFPGYVTAFPDIPDLIRVEKCPDVVLYMAWRAVQPNFFPDDSLLV